ncbi:hypothetical protein E2P81_ATG09544 [Venturia nashicola]|uniref:Uncharacterized protein n=1 Tax=Venturia nashicola TaxID=86259 RepID=A0A4Z1P589_9PEZI|nr:hypothetical protein E6O75_ATG09752 [Venturia nashicola]TLD25887.1 hypothetical protein E2P81_ATG09544 [Venturia nashicola]
MALLWVYTTPEIVIFELTQNRALPEARLSALKFSDDCDDLVRDIQLPRLWYLSTLKISHPEKVTLSVIQVSGKTLPSHSDGLYFKVCHVRFELDNDRSMARYSTRGRRTVMYKAHREASSLPEIYVHCKTLQKWALAQNKKSFPHTERVLQTRDDQAPAHV